MSSKEITIAQPVNYIADEWSECTTVDDAWNLDPNTLEPVHRTVSTPLDDVERALRQAERAYDVGRWDEEARHERAEMLERVAELLGEQDRGHRAHGCAHQRYADQRHPHGGVLPALPHPGHGR